MKYKGINNAKGYYASVTKLNEFNEFKICVLVPVDMPAHKRFLKAHYTANQMRKCFLSDELNWSPIYN